MFRILSRIPSRLTTIKRVATPQQLIAVRNDSTTTKPVQICFYDFQPYWKKYFETGKPSNYTFKYVDAKLTKQTAILANDCDAVCIFVNDTANEEVLKHLAENDVKMIALRCAGFNNVNVDVAKALGMSVCRVPAYSPYAVAEFALSLLMTLNRKVAKAYSRTRTGNFSLHGLVGWDVYGKTIGVVGTGKIGAHFAKIMAGMGCNVLCSDIKPNPELATYPNISYVELDELFSASDVVSLHAPLTRKTSYMINTHTIDLLKDGVYIINTSRGKLIETKALIQGLKSGKIGGACLDVYEEESDFFFSDKSDEDIKDEVLLRLLSFNNVIVTSHQAFLTETALTNIADATIDNIKEYIDGKTGAQLTNNCLK